MPTSDEDVQAAQAAVQKLREQVATARAEAVEREASLANDVTMVQLEREAYGLQAELAQLKERAKAANVKAGAAAVLDPVANAARIEADKQAALVEQGDMPPEAAEAANAAAKAAAAEAKATSKKGGNH
jgi:hypothetical protein